MKTLAALALLLLAGLAGCLGDGDGDDADPLDLEDASAAHAAGNATANLHKRGEWPVSGGQEIDGCGDKAFVDRGSTVVVLGVEDRGGTTMFEELGTSSHAPAPLDVKASDDCRFAFIGDDEEASAPPLAGTATNGGIYVVDFQDPASPSLVTYFPVGPRRGPHMVFYHQTADGQELVFGANADISINRFDRDAGTLTELSRYAPDYVTDVDRDPDRLDVLYQTYAHDMFVMDDPVTEQTLMYVSNWDAGLRIVDVTDPSDPVEVGAWNAFPDGHSGNLHTASTEWIGDRRITVGSVEVGFAVVGGVPYLTGDERPVLYVWDTTDPAAIELLGTWENPDGLSAGRSDAGEPLYSTHNLQLEDGRIYMAHYQLGLWALDVSTPELQADPGLLGYFDEDGMNTWDVVVQGGAILTSGAVGIQALQAPWLPVGPDGLDSRA